MSANSCHPVKYRSDTDNIWMSFYEGLHRHTALLLSLTSSAFNFTKNEITFKSLTSEFFSQQQIENFKEETTIGGINTNDKTCVK